MSVSAPGAQFAPEWHSIIAAVHALGFTFATPTLGQTWQHNDPLSPHSEHLQGRAVDFGDATAPSAAIAKALVPYATGPNASIDELIFAPLGIGFKNGVNIGKAGYGAATWAGHFDHVHVGVRAGADLAAAVHGAPVPGGFTPLGAAASTPAGTGMSTGSGWAGTLRKLSVEGVLLGGGVGLVGLGVWRAVNSTAVGSKVTGAVTSAAKTGAKVAAV